MAEQWQDKCLAGIHAFSVPAPGGTKECLWCGHTVKVPQVPPKANAPEVGEG